MPNINLDDAYILGETGAEVDKVTGLFTKDEDTTSGEKAFAQLNIGTAGSNRNLLDNPWFTVRQRGDGPFGIGYGVDRWTAVGGAPTITPRTPYGVTASWSTAIALDQYLNVNAQWLAGKTVTLSVMVDGTVYSASGVFNTTGSYIINISVGNTLFRFGYFTSKQCPFIRVGNVASGVETTINIDAVKLELGSVSTLANDAPPDKDIELQKCKAAQLMLKNGAANFIPIGFCGYSSGTEARIFIPTTIEMWKASMKATVAKTGSVVLNMNGQSIDVTTLTLTDVLSNGVYVKGTLATSVSPSYTLGALCLQANASILLDCNL